MANRFTSINPNYLVQFVTESESDTKDHLDVIGALPDHFITAMQSAWSEKLGGAVDSLKSKAGGLLGVASSGSNILSNIGIGTSFKLTSINSWVTGSPLQLQFPLQFNTVNDSYEDVVAPSLALLYACAPGEGTGGRLIPPGPTLIGSTVNGGLGNGSNDVSLVGNLLGIPSNNILSKLKGQIITVHIGTFMTIKPIIIENVNIVWSSKYTPDGYPIESEVSVSIKTPYIVTKDDLKIFFNDN